jgi:hypothetical protein
LPRSSHLVALTRSAAAIAALAVAGGCTPKSATSPTAPGPTLYAVNVHVADAGGAPVEHAFVSASSEQGLDFKETDITGTAHFSLEAGTWVMYVSRAGSSGPAQVAGGTGTVPAQGHPDSVLYRLQLADESIATGKVLLTGRTDHSGTTVAGFPVASSTETLADGSWRLSGLPPGDWQASALHFPGFQPAQFVLHVAAPGDSIGLSPITLPPLPTP